MHAVIVKKRRTINKKKYVSLKIGKSREEDTSVGLEELVQQVLIPLSFSMGVCDMGTA